MKSTATCLLLALGGTNAAYAQVAQIGTTTYNTLREAFNASEANGSTIRLIKDVDLTSYGYGISIPQTITTTLDLNGYSIKGSNTENGNIGVYGKLTLMDSKENSTGKIYSETKYEDVETGKCLIYVNGDGVFTMESGYIYAVNPDNASDNENFAVGVQNGGNVIINGGKIEAGWFTIAGNGQQITTPSNITINGGTLISTTDYAIYNPQVGNITVNGGVIYGNAGGISMKRGELTVNGGTITSKGIGNTGNWGDGTGGLSNAALIFDNPKANIKATINGGVITAEGNAVSVKNSSTATTELIIKGGTFSGETASIEPYVDEGSLAKAEDGKVTVQAGYYAAKVGENKYASLSEAIEEASTESEIKILNDINTPAASYQISDKKLTFDLNGKTIKARNIVADSNAELTFKDATATAEPIVNENYNTTYDAGTFYGELFAENGGKVTIESGKYIDTSNLLLSAIGDKTGASEIKSTVTVNGGYLQSQESTVTARYNGAVININGGVMVAKDNAVVAGNGSKGLGGTTINITGGTMIGHIESNGYVACGVYHPQEGVLNISGGKIVALGGCGILMRSGQLSQTGGEVIATGDASLMGMVGDSKVQVGTSGVIFDYDAKYPFVANTTVEISGTAKVSGTKAAVEVINTSGAASAEEAVIVKGGTFSSDVSDYCEDGYAAAKNNDGTYGVVTGDVLLVTADGYQTFSAADKTLEFSTADLTKLYVNADIEGASVKMTKTFTTTNWSSFYVPFDINVTAELLEKFAFAKIWDTELVDGAATIEFQILKAGDKIAANTPCLVKALTAGDNVLELTGTSIKKNTSVAAIDCSSIEQKFTFYGVNENTTLLDKYGYYIKASDQKFHTTDNSTLYIAPTTFYMTIQNKSDNSYDYPSASQSEAKTISFIVNGDETNGIKDVKGDAQTEAKRIYSIQGVYMGTDSSKLPAGAYIVNGKKTILK